MSAFTEQFLIQGKLSTLFSFAFAIMDRGEKKCRWSGRAAV